MTSRQPDSPVAWLRDQTWSPTAISSIVFLFFFSVRCPGTKTYCPGIAAVRPVVTGGLGCAVIGVSTTGAAQVVSTRR